MTLHQRVLSFVVAAAVITVLVTTTVVFHLGADQLKQEQQQQASVLSQTLAEAVPAVLEQSDEQRLAQLTSQFIGMPQVSGIIIEPMLSGERQIWASDLPATHVPNWFVTATGLTVNTTSVSVSNGWTQLAKLTMTFDPHQDIAELWQQLMRLVSWLLAASVVVVFTASFMFRRVTAPLGELSQRLMSLGHGDFHPTRVTTSVSDLSTLQHAFNLAGQQVARVQQSQQDELSRLRDKLMVDPVSRLPNRGYFQHQLQSFVKDEIGCTLMLLEADWLSRLRARYGYQYRDQCWRLLGEALNQDGLANTHQVVARLSHNEVAILLITDEEKTVRRYLRQLLRMINQELENISLPVNQGFHLGIAQTRTDETVSLMAKADNALQHAKRHQEVYFWPTDEQVDSRTRDAMASTYTCSMRCNKTH
ncbi:diguanylate cyclase domain-containing protein [Salinivibrio socompensis]|uniref:diguanylate cyclase domain-containing protein n=1 Tax=Salinivibrio socompensis TaxID=1510206 RepID=UPI000471FB6C|nr:diguanylate cyclase [Salinivibrio socompensis]